MTPDSLTNAGKNLTPNAAGARNQQYSNDSVFWLAWNDVVHYDVT